MFSNEKGPRAAGLEAECSATKQHWHLWCRPHGGCPCVFALAQPTEHLVHLIALPTLQHHCCPRHMFDFCDRVCFTRCWSSRSKKSSVSPYRPQCSFKTKRMPLCFLMIPCRAALPSRRSLSFLYTGACLVMAFSSSSSHEAMSNDPIWFQILTCRSSNASNSMLADCRAWPKHHSVGTRLAYWSSRRNVVMFSGPFWFQADPDAVLHITSHDCFAVDVASNGEHAVHERDAFLVVRGQPTHRSLDDFTPCCRRCGGRQ